MIINWNNTHLSEKFYIHDSSFSGFNYDYDSRVIEFQMINQFEGIVQCFRLNNVMLFKMQSCDFWHGGNAVYHIRCYSDHPFLQQLSVAQSENADNFPESYLDTGTKHIVFYLQINSGDEFFAICETVEYNWHRTVPCL